MDMFGLMMEEEMDCPAVHYENCGDALIAWLTDHPYVDMGYLCRATGKSWRQVHDELSGVIYQNPQPMLDGEEYDPLSHWELGAKYLSGNVAKKLEAAQKAARILPEIYSGNVPALKAIMPQRMAIDDLHPDLGASWIPASEYVRFIYDFLHLRETPRVYFLAEKNKWEIEVCEKDKKSFLNTVTYGVRGISYGQDKQYITAVKIIEHCLNAKPVKVYDHNPVAGQGFGNIIYEPILNRAKTIEAQEKEKEIRSAFKDWVYADPRRISRFEGYYNDTFVGYAYTAYNGDFLTFPGLNPAVKLYDHQKNSVARVLLSDENVLISHDVGTGKTYIMVASAHELHRMGISKKNLAVVPNQILTDFARAHKLLYPEDRILVVEGRDFTPKYRNEVLKKIRDEDYVAVYMASSTFDLIGMSKDYYVTKYEEEIHSVKQAISNASTAREKSQLETLEKRLSKKFAKYMSTTPEDIYLTYEDLGITTLFIDEAHNYKNITITSRCDNIVGLHTKGSAKADSALEKAHNTPRLIFATATPLTNSIADLFTIQTFLQPKLLEAHKIASFDAWINTFGERVTSIECDLDVNAGKLRPVTRFSHFHNLNDLKAIFSQVCDFHHSEGDVDLPEYGGYTEIMVPISIEQSEYFKSLSKRISDCRARLVKRKVDNPLLITHDGRAAAIDLRLVVPEADVASELTKTRVCGNKVFENYVKYPDSAQVVFCDLGTPKDSFNIYDELKNHLVALGIPEYEIAYVHDATSEAARTRLFNDINKGKIKVVIGSTAKLGVGVNVQEKLVALHHLSVPWRPADLTQREGRILRQGNTSSEVFIYHYITENTFDQFSWQLLENKQRFIASFLGGTYVDDRASDIADTVLTYAELKALAVGNMLIRERVEVSNALERAKIAERGRHNQLYRQRVLIEATPARIEQLKASAKQFKTDYKHYKNNRQEIKKPDREAFGEELSIAIAANEGCIDERVFDTYQGFTVILPSGMTKEVPFVYLVAKSGLKHYCALGEVGTKVGYSMAIEQALIHLIDQNDKLISEVERLANEMDLARADVRRGNPYTEQVRELSEKLDAIDEKFKEDEVA